MSWPEVKLESIFEIARGGSPRPIDEYITDADDGLNWISIKDASNSNKYIESTKLKIKPEGLSKTRLVKPGDFLLTNSMSFGRPYIMKTTGCIHDGWLVLSGDPNKVHPDYFYHLLGSELLKRRFSALAAGAVVKNLNIELVKGVEVPLPPLTEQKRIAAILDKADAIRRKRQQAIQLADEFLRAVFLDMFGDPVTNPKGWETERLENLVKVVSGATPSKGNETFWNGDFPWVSPKDMKTLQISESIDRINQIVFEQTNLKKIPIGSVLIVVRGMILAHTVPIGITTAQVAINQDIKAFISRGSVLPEFLLWYLLSQHANLLSKVSNAAHGTKRFEMDDLLGLPVFVPTVELQDRFARVVSAYKNTIDTIIKSQSDAQTIFKSLSQKAFSGEL